MKRTIFFIAVMACMAGLQSCLHDNDEYFDKSAAERLADAVSEDKETLEGAANGWHLEYYAGEDCQYGGYNYLVRFHGGKATVASELEPDTTVTSDYDVIDDQGPVITFNTYNELIHYFAEPEQDNVEGLQGDYEFLIKKVTQDTIYLRGKKWADDMIMTRIPQDTSWTDYMKRITDMDDSMQYCTYRFCVNGDSVADVKVNYPDDKQITVTDSAGANVYPFITTATGIRLTQTVSIAGKSVRNLIFDTKRQQYTPEGTTGAVMEAYIPPGFRKLEFYEGTFYFEDYYGDHYRMTLTADDDGNGLTVTGGNFPYSMVFDYSRATGRISLINQEFGDYKLSDGNTYDVVLLVWSLASEGSLNYKEGAGMVGTPDSDGNVWFTDNGIWAKGVDSFFIVGYANSAFNYDILGTDAYLPYFTELKRIK